jgi:hypothetical protein
MLTVPALWLLQKNHCEVYISYSMGSLELSISAFSKILPNKINKKRFAFLLKENCFLIGFVVLFKTLSYLGALFQLRILKSFSKQVK